MASSDAASGNGPRENGRDGFVLNPEDSSTFTDCTALRYEWDDEIPHVHDDPSWSDESAARFGCTPTE